MRDPWLAPKPPPPRALSPTPSPSLHPIFLHRRIQPFFTIALVPTPLQANWSWTVPALAPLIRMPLQRVTLARLMPMSVVVQVRPEAPNALASPPLRPVPLLASCPHTTAVGEAGPSVVN